MEYVAGNAMDCTFLEPLLKSRPWDAIVDFMVYKTPAFKERINLLLDSTAQYVFLSSSRVYAENGGLITEDSPRLLDVCNDKDYLQTDEYALAKARQEDILQGSGRSNWTIIRPYITFSEIRLQLSPLEKEYWLYRALYGKTIVFSKDLAERYTTLTYGLDVARGIASLLGQSSALGERFHITASESHQWKEILELYLDVIERKTGHRPKVNLLENWTPCLGGGKEQVRWDRMFDRRFDNSKINGYIDTTTFRPTLQALSDCLSQFIDHPSFRSISWPKEAGKDRLTGEWTNLKYITGMKPLLKYLMVRFGLYTY